MKKYVGKFRVLSPIDKNGNVTVNKNDTYIKGKYGTEVYRYNDNTLALYFCRKNSIKFVLEQFTVNNISMTRLLDGYNEAVYLFNESDIDKVNDIVCFKTQGKAISPFSIKTVRKLRKIRAKNS